MRNESTHALDVVGDYFRDEIYQIYEAIDSIYRATAARDVRDPGYVVAARGASDTATALHALAVVLERAFDAFQEAWQHLDVLTTYLGEDPRLIDFDRVVDIGLSTLPRRLHALSQWVRAVYPAGPSQAFAMDFEARTGDISEQCRDIVAETGQALDVVESVGERYPAVAAIVERYADPGRQVAA